MNTDFKHIFIPGDLRLPALLLLHGTGGDERDLVPLGQTVLPGAAILSVRGKVLENGAPRFFKRLSEGVFDLEDLAFRTDELAMFVKEARAEYSITQPIYALGYSNGANIAASMLLQRPDILDGAILLRSMVPFEPARIPDLRDKKILMLSGLMDPIIPVENAKRLSWMFEESGADLTFQMKPASHGLTQSDITDMQDWAKTKLVTDHSAGAGRQAS